MPDINDKPVTKDYLEVVIGRIENKIDRLENKMDARFNNQRILILVSILTIAAQIVNAWILHGNK